VTKWSIFLARVKQKATAHGATCSAERARPGRDDQDWLACAGGFTISTEACDYFYKNARVSGGTEEAGCDQVARLEKVTRKKLGDPKNPLLVSVRSGSAAPCRHDGDDSESRAQRALVQVSQPPPRTSARIRCVSAFVQMYSTVVMSCQGRPRASLARDEGKARRQAGSDVPASGWKNCEGVQGELP